MRLIYALPEPAATDALAQALASTRPDLAVVHLQGDLGAGKTSLARAFLRALGVRGAIKSPTYTLIERYPLISDRPGDGAAAEAVHLDLYRIADSAELDFLGLDELSGSARLWLVEWPERGARALPPADLRIVLVVSGEGREASLEACSPTGQGWLERLVEKGGLATSFDDKPTQISQVTD